MEAKDTVMTAQEVQKILDKWNDIDSKEMAYGTNARPDVLDLLADALVKQAEISFKAGMVERQVQYEKRIEELQETCHQWERLSKDFKLVGIKEVVEWIDKNWLDSSNLKQWQAKLKEWGIEKGE